MLANGKNVCFLFLNDFFFENSCAKFVSARLLRGLMHFRSAGLNLETLTARRRFSPLKRVLDTLFRVSALGFAVVNVGNGCVMFWPRLRSFRGSSGFDRRRLPLNSIFAPLCALLLTIRDLRRGTLTP